MSEKTVKFKRRNLPYTQIANAALRDKRMSLAVRGFFALLLSLPDDKDHSIAYFAKVGNLSTETVYKYFRILEDLDYITREQQHENGKFGTNIYEFHDIPEPKPYRNLPYTAEPNTAEPNTVEPNTENPDTKERTLGKNNPPISPQGDGAEKSTKDPGERFEALWIYYRDTYCAADHSRAGSKAKAKKAWDKLKVTDDLARKIWLYLEAKMRTDWWKRGIGIPYASSFLNGIAKGDIDLTADMPAPSAALPKPPPVREEDRWLQ